MTSVNQALVSKSVALSHTDQKIQLHKVSIDPTNDNLSECVDSTADQSNRLDSAIHVGCSRLDSAIHVGCSQKYRKIHKLKIYKIHKLDTRVHLRKSKQHKTQQNKSTLVQSRFMTLSQETRWAYSTTLLSPHGNDYCLPT